MKLNLALLGSVITLCSIPAQAQYFSQGWKPGQAAHTQAAAPKEGWAPGQPIERQPAGDGSAPETVETAPPKAPFDWDFGKILVSTLQSFGMNISLPEGVGLDKWDDRIPLITDENYEDVIVKEEFASDEEAEKRTWVLVITSQSSSKADAVSKFVDNMFDSAYNISQVEGDLPNVRWGRIDYFNVTYLTTKWNIWQAPYIVILTDRGQTLRFYRPTQIRVRDDLLLDYLRTEGFKSTPPWTGLWAPGGEREWILHLLAYYMMKAYNVFVKIPKVVLYVASGGLGSLILNWMHKPSKEQQKQLAIRQAKEDAAAKKINAKNAAEAAVAKGEGEKVKAVLSGDESSTTNTERAGRKRQQSPKKGKKSVVSVEGSYDSSSSTTSPVKTRSSTRQRKAKKAQ
ncbi:hypothetical protein D9611_002654 [Ephemerocybe angulata]|uniref:Uncharacterized protein n=1 Tax=Ephemerocybe angulata TaxID=980116 RepID=A0A8H5FE24_9AGAR|nr:hypothetical protein D9611_002654 [Tulosesus angulatus]